MTDMMTPKERVGAAINLEQTDRVPCCLALSNFVARHNGVTIEEFLTDLNLQVELQHKVFDEIGGVDFVMPIANSILDPVGSFIFMPMKVKVPGKDLPPDATPQYDESEVMTVEGYDVVLDKGWVRYAKENLIPSVFGERKEKQIKYDEEGDRRFYEERNTFFPQPLPAVMLPFELFSFARSLEKFTTDLYRRPEKVISASEAILPELITAGLASIKKPGSPVLIPVSRGSNGFISPKQFEKFVLRYLIEAVEVVVKQGSPVFFHLDQAWERFLPYFKQLPEGRYVLHFDGMTNMIKAKELLGDRFCLMGDVPATMFKLGTPATVKSYCEHLIQTVGRGGGFILSSGCGVPDDAKFENVQAMVDAAKSFVFKDS